jgi:fructose transport system ATP-binding protein
MTTDASTAPRHAVQDSSQPILEAEGLVKLFGRVVGLRGVDLRLFPGEVLAVIGDNGAGKSTLIKCLSGAMVPDRGTIKVSGEQVSFRSTQEAREAGIETVYQTLAVAPALDIASNLYLAREIRRPGIAGSVLRMLDKKAMQKHAEEHIKNLGISTLQNINQAVETLSGGQRQAVAVARAAVWGGKVLILDEPAAALGVKQTAQVMQLIQRVRDEQGLSVILITHNLPEVFQVADRVSVMRLGRRVHTGAVADATTESLIAAMTGVSEQALREVMS